MRPHEKAFAYALSSLLVVGTWAQWFYKSWHGEPVNVLVVTISLMMTLAAARVVFGNGEMGKSMEILGNVRDLARESRRTDDAGKTAEDADETER